MVSDERLQAGGPGAGRDKRRRAASEPDHGANGGAAAAAKRAAAQGQAPGNILRKAAESRSKAQPAAASTSPPSDSDDLVVVTLKASTGAIVSVEMTTSDGSRHALTDSETRRLVGERPTFASLVHDAFEAGIACVLDDRPGGADEALGETEEDIDLHDALLDALIERSAARRLLSRETLNSAVLSTIVDAATGGGKAAAPPGVA